MDNYLDNLSEDTQTKMSQVFDWFNNNVNRLESAYRDIGMRFDKISLELEDKNAQLIESFVENENIKTQLRSVLESIHSGVVMVNTEGKITLFNAAAESLYGVETSKVIMHPIAEVFEDPECAKSLLDTLKSNQGVSNQEKYVSRKGKTIPIGFTTSIVRDPKGKILGAVEIATDLTHMKQMQNQVQHAKTLAAIGQMAATVAHEIRNPLGAIGGFAGLLERDLPADDSRKSLVNKIVQGVSSLNKIVSNLLVFSRPMEIQLRKIEILEWIEEILRYAELEISRLGKDIIISRDYQIKGGKVFMDPEKFQQVLLNLTFNAIQAIPEEGELKITVGMNPENFLFINIQDNGRGIDPENMEKIFDPFFTTREQGTGLGLAIVKRIVELHSGNISVESKKGYWTRFSIVLNSEVH